MGSNITESIVSIAAAIIGVTILAVLVSRRSDTASVIQAGASGFGNLLAAATNPIADKMTAPNLSYPTVGHTFTPFQVPSF